MTWKQRLVAVIFLAVGMAIAWTPAVESQAPPKRPPVNNKYHRGRTSPPVHTVRERHARSHARHSHHLDKLRTITAPKWDCRLLGQCGPIHDQGSCGSCYIFSATTACEDAIFTAGLFKSNSGFGLSQQYFMDCQNVGGCGGGDEWEVAKLILANGCPSTDDYGPYTARSGRCKTSMPMHKVLNIGFCDSADGVASTQKIKDCMVKYGPISVAGAAGSNWDNAGPGHIIQGNSRDVNHAILLVGWDDTTSPPSWIMQNSWGTGWGDKGYANIAYGADSIGTEAFWVSAGSPVPPTPDPTPPGPTPVPGSVTTITTNQPIPAGTWEVFPSGTQAAFTDADLAWTKLRSTIAPAPLFPPNPCDDAIRRLQAQIDALRLTKEPPLAK